MPQVNMNMITIFTDEYGSICIEIKLNAKDDSYRWKLGSCYASHKFSGVGTYIEKCCLSNGNHIFSCKNSQGNGWANSVVKIGNHQFCDDFVGYNKLITINVPG